jgi:hypothetical protein
MSFARLRLILAAALLLGWLGWLAAAVASKGNVQPVSRSQLTAADYWIVAELTPSSDGRPMPTAKVVQKLRGEIATPTIEVLNLPASALPVEMDGSRTPAAGNYLLLLTQDEPNKFRIAGLAASPGYPASTPERPLVYPWNDGIRAQLRKLGVQFD